MTKFLIIILRILLTKNKRILCAAPEYLQKYPQPQSLQELSRHDCLVTKERDMTHGIWELGNGQEKKSVKVSGHLSSNSGEIVLQWALGGQRDYAAFRVGCVAVSGEWPNWCKYCRSMHKAPISGLFTGSRSIAA
ncbi:transcriptional regulator, truncation [Escherichia coli]|uniref:Transcriptional regulator, truncation n=1 Tax=Escherichia coli TaxID=562 RepID=A0A376KN29_ECOLX|nr:transcriptional regulator, truncation [Escherichia coli]